MDKEVSIDLVDKKSKGARTIKKIDSEVNLETKHRYIYCRKDESDEVANLIDELIIRCNQKDYGAQIDFSMIVGHALKLLKETDITDIQNSSLSDEDRAHEEVRKFNTMNGTNYTMFEFILNGLHKKPKKGVKQ